MRGTLGNRYIVNLLVPILSVICYVNCVAEEMPFCTSENCYFIKKSEEVGVVRITKYQENPLNEIEPLVEVGVFEVRISESEIDDASVGLDNDNFILFVKKCNEMDIIRVKNDFTEIELFMKIVIAYDFEILGTVSDHYLIVSDRRTQISAINGRTGEISSISFKGNLKFFISGSFLRFGSSEFFYSKYFFCEDLGQACLRLFKVNNDGDLLLLENITEEQLFTDFDCPCITCWSDCGSLYSMSVLWDRYINQYDKFAE